MEKAAKPRGAFCQPRPHTRPSHRALHRPAVEATEPTRAKDALRKRTEMSLFHRLRQLEQR